MLQINPEKPAFGTGQSRKSDSPSVSKPGRSLSQIIIYLTTAIGASIGIGLGWQVQGMGILGVIGLGLFIYGQLQTQSFLTAACHGWVAGYLGFVIANPWMGWTVEMLFSDSTQLHWLLTHLIHLFHGSSFALFGVCWLAARKWMSFGIVLAPAIWLLVESYFPFMFPLRHAKLLIEFTELTQIASLLGVAGVSLQLFLLSCIIPALLPSRTRWMTPAKAVMVIAIILLSGTNWLWGSHRIHQFNLTQSCYQGEHLTIGIVQGDTEHAAYHQEFLERSRTLAQNGCDLLLWPECSLGKYKIGLNDFSNETMVAMNSVGMGYRFRPMPDPGCNLIGGGYAWTGNPNANQLDSKYCSAFHLNEKEFLVGRHDKIELMAGGEYLPFANWIPNHTSLLSDPEEVDGIPLSRGSAAKPIGLVDNVSVGVVLCCEDLYPHLSASLVENESDLIIGLTNGMAFNSEIALRQHFDLSRFRAIETNRFFVRCGSYGVSGLVSPTGELIHSLPCFQEADLVVKVPKQKRSNSPFVSLGATVCIACWSLLAVSAFISICQNPIFSTNLRSEKKTESKSELHFDSRAKSFLLGWLSQNPE